MVTRPDEAANANASESACATSTSTVRAPELFQDVADSTAPVTTSRRLVLVRTGRRGDHEMNLVLGVQRLHRGLFLLHGDTDDCLALPHDSGTRSPTRR